MYSCDGGDTCNVMGGYMYSCDGGDTCTHVMGGIHVLM